MRVAVAAERGRGLRETRRGGGRARHVLPEWIAEAAVTERETIEAGHLRQRSEELALLSAQPFRMHAHRDRRALVEPLETLASRDRSVVIALKEQRAALAQQRDGV